MSLIRVLRTTAATLTHTLYVDETATDATGSVTVVVTRTADGSVVSSGTATHGATGVYTYILPGGPTAPASATWQLDELTVTWTCTVAGAVVSLYDEVEVVGAYLFGLVEARASDSSLADPVKYSTAALAARRIEVEQECERLTGRSFVPRFRRLVVSGNGTSELMLPSYDVRALRSVSTRVVPGGTATALTSLTEVPVTADGIVTRYDGDVFPAGSSNVVVEYEYGLDRPPQDLKDAALLRLRTRLNRSRSGVPDRVSSYSTPDGASYNLRRPVRGSTGIDDVDSVYADYEAPPRGFA